MPKDVSAKYPANVPKKVKVANPRFTGHGSSAAWLREQKAPWLVAENLAFPAREGHCHAAIENVPPEIDAGRVSIKWMVGEGTVNHGGWNAGEFFRRHYPAAPPRPD